MQEKKASRNATSAALAPGLAGSLFTMTEQPGYLPLAETEDTRMITVRFYQLPQSYKNWILKGRCCI